MLQALDVSALSLPPLLALFFAAAAVVGVAGVTMVAAADRLADRTGLGEAVTGAVMLGVATSLSGTVTSITASADGFPSLAVGNALGGIAVQTFFLSLADMLYRRANLEHAAASPTNLLQCGLLLALLSIPLIAMSLPPVSIWGLHPASLVLVLAYVLGLRLTRAVQERPLWGPTLTRETAPDEPDEPRGGRPLKALLLRFVLLALLLTAAGFVIARSGAAIALRTGLGETVVGALATAVATSLPELVTTLAAVRRGALTLAVGGIIGGNTFDVLFLVLADAAYRPGSVYHAIDRQQLFLVGLAILMTAVLLLGLLRRERYGIGRIGFESVLIFCLYVAGAATLVAIR